MLSIHLIGDRSPVHGPSDRHKDPTPSSSPVGAVEDKLVSVIVPSFNQGRFLRETLDSILNQDYRPLEVLVLDGGSTDDSVAILRSYTGAPELQWWSEPDDGIEDAVNRGLQRARGSILGIQSSDDLYAPGAIRRAVEAFARDPELALVYGDVEYIDAESTVHGREALEPFNLARYLGRFTYIPQPTAFFRASVAAAIGGWRKECSFARACDAGRNPAVSKGQRRYRKIQCASRQRQLQALRPGVGRSLRGKRAAKHHRCRSTTRKDFSHG